MSADCGAQIREAAREVEHPLELLAVALLAPDVVVEVLQPSGRVAARRLEMAVVPGTDPHVRPGGGYGEAAQALEQLRFGQVPSAVVEVLESAPATSPRVPGAGGVAVAQAHGRLRAPRGVGRNGPC